MSTRASPVSDGDDGTPVILAAPISGSADGAPRLMIDDAFESGDVDDLDAAANASDFDLASIIHSSQIEASHNEGVNGGPNATNHALGSSSSSSSLNSTSIRNGRVVPSPLRIVTPTFTKAPGLSLPQLETAKLSDEPNLASTSNGGHREQFEDISLSPPASPHATTSLSPDQVPIPVSPLTLTTPSSSNFSGSLNSLSLSSDRPRAAASILRTVSPRPNYLSPTSTVPVPPNIDPVPKRAQTPRSRPGTPQSPTFNSSISSVVSSHQSNSSSLSSTRGHGHARSTATASALEKVLSKTRPSHLPPKPRVEDIKHQRDWDEMMRKARQHEDVKAEQQRAKAREREVEAAGKMAIWEKEIVPDWRKVMRPGGSGEKYRKMWWDGIPGKLRGSLWSAAIGNGLALSKETYKTCISRANRAIASGSFPQETLSEIILDVQNTLPNLHIFNAEYGPMHQDLKDMLCAWVVSRSDEGLGYVRGASNVAAMFILNMPIDQAFMAMRNLLERHCLRSFYGGEGSDDDLEAYYRIFDTLLADGMPKVYFNFKQHQISPSTYLPSWLVPLFLNHLPFEMTARIWDVIILEGDSFIFRVAIAVLGVLEGRLFFPDKKELMEVLRGENKAALEIARREGLAVDMSARYEQYGMSEKALWDRIYEMDEWWRESTWQRLITRELPDL